MSDPTALLQPATQKPPEKDIVSPEVLDTSKKSDSADVSEERLKKKSVKRKPVDPTYRGWRETSHWERDDILTEADELRDILSHTTFVDRYLPAKLYGDWYHGVGLFFVAGLSSWIFGWFRFSLAPVFLIMVVASLFYRTSVRKYRTALREQAQREFSVKAIENDFETMDWLNTFLDKFWIYLEPSVAKIVTDQANPILAGLPIPAFVKALWIDTFTVGTKPPRIDLVKTLPRTNDDIVVMDWQVSFTPNALHDANAKQMKNKINQSVTVKANLFGIKIPITVSDVSFKSLVRVRMRMMTAFPHIETINVTLLEPPQYDFVARVFGDSIFNWEVLSIPGLHLFIDEMIKKFVGPMLFSPLSFQLNVQQLLSGNSLNSSIGILALTVHNARGLKGFDSFGNTLDPYLTFGYQGTVLAKTKTIKETDSPVWNETVYILLKSLSEPLAISVIDYNEVRKDRTVGAIQLDLEDLADDPKKDGVTGRFMRNNKPVGELLLDLSFMPTLEAKTQPDGAIIPPPELNTGIARIEINEGRHFKSKKPLQSYVELYLNRKLVLTTKVQKDTNTPAWNQAHEEMITDRRKTRARLVVKDKKSDSTVGEINSSLNELVDSMEVDNTWFPIRGGGEIRLSTTWKPVALTNVSGSGGYTEPIGVVRVSIEKAENLRNLETVGKIDPYVRLLINGFQRARTVACDSTLNPVWNEISYVTVTSANQRLTVEAMDVEKHSPDRTLGSFDVRLNEIIKKGDDGKYVEYIDTEKRESKLISKKGARGIVTYSLSFYPALPVMDLDEIKEEEEIIKKQEQEKLEAEKEKAENEKEKKTDSTKKRVPEVEETSLAGKKLKLSLDELLEYQSGVLVYKIISGSFGKTGTYLTAYFDSHGFPDYISQKLDRRHMDIETTGECIIKELEWSKAYFRLVKEKDDTRAEKSIAELSLPTLQLLKNCYNAPQVITLKGGAECSVKIQCSWIPYLPSTLPPQDSITNSGNLSITTLNASNLIAADSNGKSDPYVELYLNNDEDEFFKSNKVKKSLDPSWNETTQVSIGNRIDTVIRVEVYDWDMGPVQDDLLGVGYIHLADVDPTKPTELSVPLKGEKGEDGGVVNFKFSFKPDYVLLVNARTDDLVGDTIGTSIGAIGGLGKGVGKGGLKVMSKGGSILKKGLRFGKKEND